MKKNTEPLQPETFYHVYNRGINGETILNTSRGDFSTSINLKKGVNNIVIKAKKKYSGEALILRQILVE